MKEECVKGQREVMGVMAVIVLLIMKRSGRDE